MKASPVRPGDHLEFFAEIELLGALSACPGGDCSSEHSSDTALCYPLLVEIFNSSVEALGDWKSPETNGYDRTHGLWATGGHTGTQKPSNRRPVAELTAL
jgi:hypothetical protein